MKKIFNIAVIGLAGTILTGCMVQPYQQRIQPTVAVQPAYPQPALQPEIIASQNKNELFTQFGDEPELGRVLNDLNAVRSRLERIERAMIRLDRRMQLLERRELNRMSSSLDQADTTAMAPLDAMGESVASLPRAQNAYGGRYQTVGYQYGQGYNAVTSSLQPAAANYRASPKRSAGLPRLADVTPKRSMNAGMSVWTIAYEPSKIWPNRGQLAASREVVESLRSDKPVALFARGANPTSKEFRERVKAVSRYLSKVTEVKSVPISAIAAPHLAEDTIEIFATR